MGSLEYDYKVNNGILSLKAKNDYTIASGVTRNDKDNLIRIKNSRCPLGNTYQIYIFSITIESLKKMYE
jgi:hypothetical protein